MLVLDTNHYSELERNTAMGQRLIARLVASRMERALPIAGIEEQLRGWLAEINRRQDLDQQIVPYARFQKQVESFGNWTILGWDAECAVLFRGFRTQGVRIGTMDLKIACIALAHDATLLTRNTADFAQVPGLKFADWLE